MDKLLSHFFKFWRLRSEESRRRSAALLAKLKLDAVERTLIWQKEVRARFQCIFYVLLGILFLALYINARLHMINILEVSTLLFIYLKLTFFLAALAILTAIQRNVVASDLAYMLKRSTDEID